MFGSPLANPVFFRLAAFRDDDIAHHAEPLTRTPALCHRKMKIETISSTIPARQHQFLLREDHDKNATPRQQRVIDRAEPSEPNKFAQTSPICISKRPWQPKEGRGCLAVRLRALSTESQTSPSPPPPPHTCAALHFTTPRPICSKQGFPGYNAEGPVPHWGSIIPPQRLVRPTFAMDWPEFRKRAQSHQPRHATLPPAPPYIEWQTWDTPHDNHIGCDMATRGGPLQG
ncbi:hypothetical protein B0H67DRAFT_144069 [Lasiosphaeris hirsuta]|uniref:Uncharacterized protein n=1 Tax=Lasiosphaeris hirsuta TaxID=260670 RepID=A0AA40B1I4_9PEZI|nr:hypothetical protein B0H67DRAFT_144069 [Lasiosphaeris hirsuta]